MLAVGDYSLNSQTAVKIPHKESAIVNSASVGKVGLVVITQCVAYGVIAFFAVILM